MSVKWEHSLLGCLDDWLPCCLAFLAPCWAAGKNAEDMKENFYLHCCCSMVPCASCFMHYKIRDEIRDEVGIPDSEDSCLTATCAYLCCLPCAYYQEAREIDAWKKRGAESTQTLQQPRTQQPVAKNAAQVVPTMEIKVTTDGPTMERK